MNELDFSNTSDSKAPVFKGPVPPITAKMMDIARNPSQGWRDQYFLDRAARQNEKDEERKNKWAMRKCKKIVARDQEKQQ